MIDEQRCPKCGTTLSHSDSTPFCLHCRREEHLKAAIKRRRESPRVLAGVDIDAAVAHLQGLPVLVELLGRRPVKVDVGHHADGGCGGRAFPRQRKIRVYSGPDVTPARVLEVVVHELCHVATPLHGHDERFRRVFQRAVREAWGVEVPIDVNRGWHKNASYHMGEIIVEVLTAKIAAGEVLLWEYAPLPVEKAPRAELAQERVEKRAAHAVAMLKQSERRLKIAKTVHRRWVAKVGYYERQAAKRGQK